MSLEQEYIVGGNYLLNESAKEAYRSYLLAYNSHSMKDIFDIHRLDLKVNVGSSSSRFCGFLGISSAHHFVSLQVEIRPMWWGRGRIYMYSAFVFYLHNFKLS